MGTSPVSARNQADAALRRLSLPDVSSATAVAAHLELSLATVLRALEEGHLPGRRIGGRWFVSRPALFAWLDSRADAELGHEPEEECSPSRLRPVSSDEPDETERT